MVGVRQSPVSGGEEARSSAVDMEAQQQVHLLELQVCTHILPCRAPGLRGSGAEGTVSGLFL